MALEDREKWDKKYKENSKLLIDTEATLFVRKYCNVTTFKEALDLACGVGRNSIFLAKKGFKVDAIDISKIALDVLRDKGEKNINIIEADLDNFIPKKEYGLIIKCNFLDRDLINKTKMFLKKGGVYIVESYVEDSNNEKKSYNHEFLLKKDELLKIFKSDFEVLEYKTFWKESYEKYKIKKATIAVRKI